MGILDSGERFEFETGAVRDMQEGKGRCDLIPFDIAADIMENYDNAKVFYWLNEFRCTGNRGTLLLILEMFVRERGWDMPTMMLEYAVHLEQGCKKYGENNWQKGIPVRCYINSAIRHYLKWLRGDQDEPHDRAFCWNILCCIWTCKHMPELNEYKGKKCQYE